MICACSLAIDRHRARDSIPRESCCRSITSLRRHSHRQHRAEARFAAVHLLVGFGHAAQRIGRASIVIFALRPVTTTRDPSAGRSWAVARPIPWCRL
jgi:hypothetical protein